MLRQRRRQQRRRQPSPRREGRDNIPQATSASPPASELGAAFVLTRVCRARRPFGRPSVRPPCLAAASFVVAAAATVADQDESIGYKSTVAAIMAAVHCTECNRTKTDRRSSRAVFAILARPAARVCGGLAGWLAGWMDVRERGGGVAGTAPRWLCGALCGRDAGGGPGRVATPPSGRPPRRRTNAPPVAHREARPPAVASSPSAAMAAALSSSIAKCCKSVR